MAKITADMKRIFEKAKPFIVATADKDGKPNGVPVGLTKIVSDDEVMVVDVHMQKTRQNIDENPRVAVSFWTLEAGYGYQFKGRARVETEGKHFEEAKQMLQGRKYTFDPKAVVIVKVEEIYYIGRDKDSTVRLD